MNFASLESRTANIGDDIQVLAALQFLPDGVVFVDRDRIGRARVADGTKIILNGWFMHSPAAWPPPASFDPLVVSFHASPAKFRDSARLDYLRERSAEQPIGARDLDTLALFKESGIENAYWSGCLTLTLRTNVPIVRQERVLAVDVSPQGLRSLRARTVRPIVELTQLLAPSHRDWRWRLIERRRLTRPARFAIARGRLDDFASAAAVVTGRLHAALPCLALGTPVLFVTDKPADARLASWLPHLHWCSTEDFEAGRFEFSFANPPANLDTWRGMADSLSATCQQFTGVQPRAYAEVA